MSTTAPHPSSTPTDTPTDSVGQAGPLWKKLVVSWGAVLAIAGILIALFGAAWVAEARSYQNAKACAPNARSTASCTITQSTTVTSSSMQGGGTADGAVESTTVTVANPKGATALFDGMPALHQGETVTIQMWDGRIAQLRVNGHVYASQYEPPPPSTAWYMAYVGILLLLLGAFLILRRGQRLSKGQG